MHSLIEFHIMFHFSLVYDQRREKNQLYAIENAQFFNYTYISPVLIIKKFNLLKLQNDLMFIYLLFYVPSKYHIFFSIKGVTF